MNSPPLPASPEHSPDPRSPIRALLHLRTQELAAQAGRIPPHVSQLDYEQAKHDLTGESDLDRQDAVLSSLEAVITSDAPLPIRASAWTDAELDESILRLCEEFPDARLTACSRALEHCRRSTPRGTRESLLTAMRGMLRRDGETKPGVLPAAA